MSLSSSKFVFDSKPDSTMVRYLVSRIQSRIQRLELKITSLVTLRLFPLPSELRQLSPEEIYAKWKPHMKRRASKSFAIALVEHAHQSIAKDMAPETVKRSLAFLLDQYELLSTQLSQLEQEATSLFNNFPRHNEALYPFPGLAQSL